MFSIEGNPWAKLLKKYPIAYGIEAGFDDLGDIHNEWLKTFLLAEDDYTLQAHRGSYKTTTLAIAMALLLIIRPNENIMFLRKADNDVKEIIKQVSMLLDTEYFQMLSLSLYGKEIVKTAESAFEIDTNLKTSPRGAPQLLGMGSKGSLTSKHADVVITDDIININDRLSRAHRERTKFTYQELQNIKNRGGRMINTGTPWHKDDAFTIMPNIDKYTCYDTGLMSKEEIEELKDSMSPSLFSANYELRHISDDDLIFKDARIDYDNNTSKIYNGYVHVDASYGGKDDTAMTILNRHEDGNIYVYGKIWEEGIMSEGVIEEIEDLRKRFRAGTMYMETNADKGLVLNEYMEEPTKAYFESMNKHIKITTYLLKNWKKVIFIEDTDREYIKQITDYNENASKDDAPDSLASLIMQTEENKKVRRGVRVMRGIV